MREYNGVQSILLVFEDLLETEDEGDKRIRDDAQLSGKQINLSSSSKFMVIGFDL